MTRWGGARGRGLNFRPTSEGSACERRKKILYEELATAECPSKLWRFSGGDRREYTDGQLASREAFTSGDCGHCKPGTPSLARINFSKTARSPGEVRRGKRRRSLWTHEHTLDNWANQDILLHFADTQRDISAWIFNF